MFCIRVVVTYLLLLVYDLTTSLIWRHWFCTSTDCGIYVMMYADEFMSQSLHKRIVGPIHFDKDDARRYRRDLAINMWAHSTLEVETHSFVPSEKPEEQYIFVDEKQEICPFELTVSSINPTSSINRTSPSPKKRKRQGRARRWKSCKWEWTQYLVSNNCFWFQSNNALMCYVMNVFACGFGNTILFFFLGRTTHYLVMMDVFVCAFWIFLIMSFVCYWDVDLRFS